jgi:hypothetical protein
MRRTDKLGLQVPLSRVVAPSDLAAAPPVERRACKDRRKAENGPPSRHERRTTLEARRPQVVELEMSPSEWAMFDDPAPAGSSGH